VSPIRKLSSWAGQSWAEGPRGLDLLPLLSRLHGMRGSGKVAAKGIADDMFASSTL